MAAGLMTAAAVRRGRWLVGCAAVLGLGLVGCGSPDAGDDSDVRAAADGGYPVSVPTLHGAVTIDEAPERIVALSVATADELLSLGASPIAVACQSVAIESDFPWMVDEVTDLCDGTLANDSGELNVEAIAATEPDLIIASTWQVAEKSVFDRLNMVAPTVAPDSAAANVDWDERLRTTAQATDQTEEAEMLIAQIESDFADVGESVPGGAAKTYQWVRVDDSGYSFGNGSMFELFGLRPADNQDNTQTGDPLSKEHTEELDADLLAVWAPSQEVRESLDGDRLFQDLPAVSNGTVYYADLAFANAINAPAPMALRWLKDELAPTIQALGE